MQEVFVDLWKFQEAFKSLTTLQKFTLTRDRVVVPNMNSLMKHQTDKAPSIQMLS